MNYTKTAPVGVDISIQGFQQVMYNVLKSKWPVDDSSFDCYGRAYRNQTSDGYIPEVFNGSANAGGKEYKEVMFDDRLKALCFFGVSETTRYDNGTTTAKVSLIFMVNIKSLKPTTVHRGDEEVRNDVEKFAAAKRFNFTLTSIETGIDTVFRDYSGWRKKEGIKNRDMQPLHCFRLNFDTVYNINQC